MWIVPKLCWKTQESKFPETEEERKPQKEESLAQEMLLVTLSPAESKASAQFLSLILHRHFKTWLKWGTQKCFCHTGSKIYMADGDNHMQQACHTNIVTELKSRKILNSRGWAAPYTPLDQSP